LVIATTSNYLGGSFPGTPENWNLSVQGGAFFAPILARTSTTPSQIYSWQEGLFVGMVNDLDANDGQLFLYDNNDFIEVLSDVGPLPNTMVALGQQVYFLSGAGVHQADITNVRKQSGTKTVSGAIAEYFERHKPFADRNCWSVYDKLTGQIWIGFENDQGRQFLCMDPLNTDDRMSESNRFSWFTGIPAELATESEETPYLWTKEETKGYLFRLAGEGTQDLYNPTSPKRIAAKFITGPILFNSISAATSTMKDIHLAATNFQRNKIKLSILINTTVESQALPVVEVTGITDGANSAYEPGAFEDGCFQENSMDTFIADPWVQARGQWFRIILEETGYNVPWELVTLGARGLSLGYKRSY
jgi:hypothetical protein